MADAENGNAAEIRINILQSAPPKIRHAKERLHIKNMIEAEIKISNKLKQPITNISIIIAGEIKMIRKIHKESETVRVRIS